MRKCPEFIRQIFIICFMVLCVHSLTVPAEEKQPGAAGLSKEDALRAGERIYRQGMLPSNKPVEAVVKGDIAIEGSMFTCQSCHMRAGLGSFEGGVYSPPTNGSSLFQPLKLVYKGIVQDQVPPRRPAYNDATLAEVLRYGDDPSGRILNDVMPRYLLEDKDMALLVSYLKSLSAQFSPGVTNKTLLFATVITDDVTPLDRDAMLAPLENYVDNKNKLADYFETQAGVRSRRMAEGMFDSKELAIRKLALSHWVLHGPAETWRAQLEDYNRRQPVFAILGGIANGEWKPIHQFSEENQIPCIFPYADFPVISKSDWYTLYLSKGYYQEGEGAARYLNALNQSIKDQPIVQVVRDSREGKALAEGFIKTWHDLGHSAPVTVTLKAGEKFTKDLLPKLPKKKKPVALLLWDDATALPALETIADDKKWPEMVFLSYGYMGKRIWSIKEAVRTFAYITYPYKLPQSATKKTQSTMKKIFPADTGKIGNQTYAIIEVLNMALMNMKGNYYRDNFLDVIDCIMDQEVPLFERLSFGPGQRYASKGCYIVQLSKGEKPGLIRKSDWVIH